jgi:hypothetical protein
MEGRWETDEHVRFLQGISASKISYNLKREKLEIYSGSCKDKN